MSGRKILILAVANDAENTSLARSFLTEYADCPPREVKMVRITAEELRQAAALEPVHD